MKALIIVNPAAGRANNKSAAEIIRRALRLRGYFCDTAYTHCANDAENIARNRAGGYDLVVCLGGDGTLNETVNGLNCLKSCPPVAYLPAGTTNDFAKSLGLSTDVSRTMNGILNGKRQKLDIGKTDGRCFVYVASFGFLSESSYLTPAWLKKRIGRAAYILEGTRELPFTKAYRMKVFDNGEPVREGDFVFGAVSNSTCIGGLLHYGEGDVDLNDGLHEVILVEKPKTPGKLLNIIKALKNRSFDYDGITLFHSKSVRFECEREIEWSLDGEKRTPGRIVEIENIPSAIEFIVPKRTIGANRLLSGKVSKK